MKEWNSLNFLIWVFAENYDVFGGKNTFYICTKDKLTQFLKNALVDQNDQQANTVLTFDTRKKNKRKKKKK